MRPVVLAVLLAGCGRIAFDPRGDGAGGGSDAVTSDGAQCTGPFGPLRNLTEINTAFDEEGGFLSADGLELYFASDRPGPGAYDLYVAVRSDRTQPFGTPTLLSALSTSAEDNDPYLSPDGLELWFNSGSVVVRTTRPDRGSPWGAVVPVDGINIGTDNGAVDLTDDELTVYFNSIAPAAMGQDLYRAVRQSKTDPFGTAVPQVAVNDANANDWCPVIMADRAHVLFSSGRSTNYDIYISAIDANGDLGPATPYTVLNTTSDEPDAFVTRDDRYIGVSSDRPGGAGLRDIYLMERSCP